MRKIITILLVLFLVSIIFAEEKIPINGYDILKLGMSFEKVKVVIKKDGNFKKEGNYNLEKVPFRQYYRYYKSNQSEVSVWFSSQKLEQIRDVFGGRKLAKIESAREVFKEKRKEFISKWGTPTRDEKYLVVWDKVDNIAVLRLEPPENPYAYPVLKLIVSVNKTSKEVQLAIKGY